MATLDTINLSILDFKVAFQISIESLYNYKSIHIGF